MFAVDDPGDPPEKEPTEQPQKPINVPKYRPNARDFRNDLHFLLAKVNMVRSIEPRTCQQMIERVNENVKRFNSFVFEDWRRIQDTFERSKSDKLNEAIEDAQSANSDVLKSISDIADKTLKEINQNCEQLRSFDTNKQIVDKIVQLQKEQIEAASKLAAIPEKYEKSMQARYTPVEKITGPQ